jgi:catechol 2,3-dioxygenase-like lactoylglutathione lyase family enzyme
MEPRISIITLGVEDLRRATEFYRSGLGLPLRKESDQNISFFDMGHVWLALFPRASLAEDAQVPADGNGFRSFTLAHNLRSPEEVDQVFDQAVKAGAKAVKSPQKVFWGGYSGYFADPDGFLWELAHNPFIWVE